jgi:hypothetical protein
VGQVGHLPELYEDARTEKYKTKACEQTENNDGNAGF